MPTFNTQVTTSVEVDFEVFCANCGEGLCNLSETRDSYNRKMPQVTVGLCPRCYGKLEDEIESLKQEIMELENKKEEQ